MYQHIMLKEKGRSWAAAPAICTELKGSDPLVERGVIDPLFAGRIPFEAINQALITCGMGKKPGTDCFGKLRLKT